MPLRGHGLLAGAGRLRQPNGWGVIRFAVAGTRVSGREGGCPSLVNVAGSDLGELATDLSQAPALLITEEQEGCISLTGWANPFCRRPDKGRNKG